MKGNTETGSLGFYLRPCLCVFRHSVPNGRGEMGLEMFCAVTVQEMRTRMCNLSQTFLTLPLKYLKKPGSPRGMLTGEG